MSGKKRSEVQAALHAASRAANAARGLLADADARALHTLAGSWQQELRRAESAAARRPSVPSSLQGDGIASAKARAGSADAALDHARRAQKAADEAHAQAKALDRAAANAFASAQRQLDDAQRALDAKVGTHYMDPEFAKASQAGQAFEAAKREASAARSAVQRATERGQAAVEAASAAAAAAENVCRVIDSAVAAAKDRRHREEQARRIAEDARRRAAEAIAGAAGALQSLPGGDARKFVPSEYESLQQTLTDAEAAFGRQNSEAARRGAERVQADSLRLGDRLAHARADFDRRKAEAAAALAGLGSALDGADPGLIRDWSDTPAAYDEGTNAIASVREGVEREDFVVATQVAGRAAEGLRQAMQSGAEARAADERRSSIGQAVMNVLQEMNFDVSYESGTRDEPLRISGQTADETGRGDFDLAIPLDGEVDFEVTAESGDSACVAAVNQLRDKLAERGVPWVTTDWGHASEAAASTGRGQARARTKTQTQTATRTSTR